MKVLTRCKDCAGQGYHISHHNGDYNTCWDCNGHGYLVRGEKIPKELEFSVISGEIVSPCCDDNRKRLSDDIDKYLEHREDEEKRIRDAESILESSKSKTFKY